MKMIQPVTMDAARMGAGEIRDLVAPQNIGFALLHSAHARAEQTVAQDADGHGHGDHLADDTALLRVESLRKDEEEHHGEEIVEENHGALAKGQLEIDFDQRQIALHSRSFFPVSSINASSRDGRRRWTSSSSMPC
jgi:hypothetical protein